jgi:dTDP-4-amino-4,6-dideoxygalactose transaminase
MRAAGIGSGDEVIVPAHTFVASCSAIVNVGATPVLIDVTKDFNIDVDKIEPLINNKTNLENVYVSTGGGALLEYLQNKILYNKILVGLEIYI